MALRITSRRRILFALGRMRHHAREDEGAEIVEMALSIVVFLTFLFGMMEVALALYSYFFISEAAREGARYAIVRGSTCSGFASACPAASSDIQNYVQTLTFPGINPSYMTVTPVWAHYVNAASSCPAAPSVCNSPGNLVTVTVNYNFPLILPFAPAKSFTMSSTSAMIIAQ